MAGDAAARRTVATNADLNCMIGMCSFLNDGEAPRSMRSKQERHRVEDSPGLDREKEELKKNVDGRASI